ncbi:restriction endonuclease subunit S, partial [Methanocaldococcus infernus]
KIKAGGTPKTTVKEYYENGYIPFAKIEDITRSNKYLTSTKVKITEKGLNNSNAWKVPKNSLLFAMYGSIGEVAINKIELATNQAILGIIPKESILDVEFLYYYMYHNKKYYASLGLQTTQKNLNAHMVKSFKIPLPPLNEQKAIAKVLSDFDSLIETITKQIEALTKAKKGMMKILFSKGAFDHKEFKETEIGTIPKDWDVVKLGDIVRYIKGKKPEIIVENYENGVLPYLSTDYLRNGVTQYVKPTKKDIIVDDGDIILLWDGSNAGEFFLSKRGVLASTMVKLILKTEIHRLYLFYALKNKELILKSLTKGTGIPHVDKNVFNNLKIPLPPLNEQKAIAERLKSIDNLIETKKKEKEQVEKAKKEIMNLLLTGQVRVKSLT